jgi:bifunctional DNase/RNase
MLVKVEFSSFAVDPDSSTPFIVLRESGGRRTISVTVGPLQGGAIAAATLKAPSFQPLTIDMAASLMEKLGGTLVRAIIDRSPPEDLTARLDITEDGNIHFVACAPCDAVALALKCRAPLFVREAVFDFTAPKSNLSEQEKLRTHIAALDTLEFGTVYLE